MKSQMSTLKSLREIHSRKIGKLSDKWDIYLEVYERLLAPFRNEPISLLEIGVQNGGSLETWGTFFKNAKIIVGCDVNSRCSELRFDDKRVNIVIGDATSQNAANQIDKISKTFDLIIEDGSHRSDDIIKTFVEFFPKLRPGGVYIAEDLHCCYWEEMEGGLGYPYSGMEYFKSLCDCLNSNHWHREDATPVDFINKIGKKYGASVSNDFLNSILSVQFFDSLCVIKKAHQGQKTRIEHRIIGGNSEVVAPGHLQLHRTAMPFNKQKENSLNGLIDYASKVTILAEENTKLTEENTRLFDKNAKLFEENTRLISECTLLQDHLLEIYGSNSWKLTKPLRSTKNALKSLYTQIIASTKK